MISLQAVALVWWRVLLASSTLLALIPKKQWKTLSRKTVPMATTSFFAAMTEPFLFRQKIKWFELGLGILILPGMALVLGDVNWDMKIGFALGLLGAFLAAVFSALNKKVIENGAPQPLVMSFVELFTATLFCSLLLPVWCWIWPDTQILPQNNDLTWLLVLAWACTILPHYLTILAMRHISAFTFNLSLNLEPVYGILLAVLLFREDKELGTDFYIGMSVILVAVFSHPFLKKYFDKPCY
jgi:drug/metabolite transporter (DMT)-like permease